MWASSPTALRNKYNGYRRSLSSTFRQEYIAFAENIALRSNISYAARHISLKTRNTRSIRMFLVFYLLFAVFTMPK